MKLHFEKVTGAHLDTIFSWLLEAHIMEFWDNSQAHKDDILNFVNGRKEPSNYCDGKYFYWIASCDGHKFAMLMTIQETAEDHEGGIKLNHLSKTGHTYGVDYMIGDKNYFGKGYGAKTLAEFLDFFRRDFDLSADTFIIDPASDNPKAKHVYMKAGFEHVCDFMMEGDVSGAGKEHHLFVKKFEPESLVKIKLICEEDAADIAANIDYEVVRNVGAEIPWPYKIEDAREFIDLCLIYIKNDVKNEFVIRDKDNVFIGVITLHLKQHEDSEAPGQIGYWISPLQRKKGYAFAAFKNVILCAQNIGFSRVWASARFDNIASINLIKKIGMKEFKEGYDVYEEKKLRNIFFEMNI